MLPFFMQMFDIEYCILALEAILNEVLSVLTSTEIWHISLDGRFRSSLCSLLQRTLISLIGMHVDKVIIGNIYCKSSGYLFIASARRSNVIASADINIT